MKRADIKRMLLKTHPDYEISTEMTERMFIKADEKQINRIKEAGLKKLGNTPESQEVNISESRFVNADIVKPSGKRRTAIPAAVAACVAVASVTVPLIYRNSEHGSPAQNSTVAFSDTAGITEYEEEYINEQNSENAEESNFVLSENNGFVLKEIKTYDEYTEISAPCIADGKIYVQGKTESDGVYMLYWRDPETNAEKYTDFFYEQDIPDRYKTSDGECPTFIINDFYISDDGYLYYFGSVQEWNEGRKTDGAAGKFNLSTGENEKIRYFDSISFDKVTAYSEGKFRITASENGENVLYYLDDSFEALSEVNAEINFAVPYEENLYEFDCPYAINNRHNSGGTEYCIIDGLSSDRHRSFISASDMSDGETQEYISIRHSCIAKNGKIFSSYVIPGNDGYEHMSFTSCNGIFPELYGYDDIRNGDISGIGENILVSCWNSDEAEYMISVYTQDGEKLYDFDYPDNHINSLGNKTGESGLQYFYIARDDNKAFCYEPETDTKTELTALNENIDFENDEFEITVNSFSEKYNIIAWNSSCIYGYNTDTDEFSLICDSLGSFGIDFLQFVVSDDGTIYCTAEGSNTLYAVVKED